LAAGGAVPATRRMSRSADRRRVGVHRAGVPDERTPLFGFLRERSLRGRYGEPVVVVSGLPRSGTSMMMRMLDAGGARVVTDHVREADEDNPRGYFEVEQVKDLEQSEDRGWLKDCRGAVIKIISFLLKNLPEDNQYKVIFMKRHLDEVVASQNKMLVRRGEATDESNDEATKKRYAIHLKKVAFFMEEAPNFRSLEVDYKEVLEDPRRNARRVKRFLGLDLDLDSMVRAVDPQLYRNRR
jgi:hypothetical protein